LLTLTDRRAMNLVIWSFGHLVIADQSIDWEIDRQ
jgi:hypothetical protein